LDIKVPAGCTATVHVPVLNANKVKESHKKIGQLPEVNFLKEEDGYATYKILSGDYKFVSRL
jgi:hypothetical protein